MRSSPDVSMPKSLFPTGAWAILVLLLVSVILQLYVTHEHFIINTKACHNTLSRHTLDTAPIFHSRLLKVSNPETIQLSPSIKQILQVQTYRSDGTT